MVLVVDELRCPRDARIASLRNTVILREHQDIRG